MCIACSAAAVVTTLEGGVGSATSEGHAPQRVRTCAASSGLIQQELPVHYRVDLKGTLKLTRVA